MLQLRERTETLPLPRQRVHGEIRVLFLQGPPCRFARELGEALVIRGVRVRRVNLCFGDWLFWNDARSTSYRGTADRWERWLATFVAKEGITDIIYFGDRFPYHRAARRVARRNGLNVTAIEYGYLRPDWITCEPFGQSGFSHLTRDPATLRAAAVSLPDIDFLPAHKPSFAAEAAGETIYHFGNWMTAAFWPGYMADRVHHPLREYLNYPLRFLRARLGRTRSRRLADCLAGQRYFLVPLQMQGDYQIRANSPYSDQRKFLEEIFRSFARHAAPDARLVIKPHPLDNGLEDWRTIVRTLAERAGLANRVDLIDGGDLKELTGSAAGLITVNSTSALTALRIGCPVKAMGLAVYDIRDVTHQGALDTFWQKPEAPDPDTLRAFLKVLAHHCHVRGTFHGAAGRRAGVQALAERLTRGPLWPAIFEDALPRRERAAELGIPLDD